MSSSPLHSSFVDSACRHLAYSRKQKSLGLLCSNFVALYNRDDVDAIGLDDAARRLGVERRRIYDIVNVLESIGVLVRKGKNQYSWIGFSGIPKALQDLKDSALQDPLLQNAQDPPIKVLEEEDDELPNQGTDIEGEKGTGLLDSTLVNSANSGPKPALDQRREKSLGLLTQNFVKLFITTDADTISLDEAAKILLGDAHDAVNMRTKVRRLYDIANVLSSMNLIEKTHHAETRKPAFRWLGLEGRQISETGAPVTAAPFAKHPKKRSFGTELTNVASKRPNLGPYSDDSRVKATVSGADLAECNRTAQQLIHGPKGGFVFGPFQPVPVKREYTTVQKGGERECVSDWETMANAFRPQYHNQAMSDLFTHFVEAWNSWRHSTSFL
ncbi:DP-E2F-like 2 isoform X2 [Carex rostrata]